MTAALDLDPDRTSYDLVLHLRSLAPPNVGDRLARIHDGVAVLSDADVVATHDEMVWGDRVRLDESPRTATGQARRRQFERFRAWATTADRSLSPGFTIRRVNSFVEGEYTVLCPPFVGLSLHDGDDVVAVFPHTHEGTTYTVQGCLESLRPPDVAPPEAES